jgi:hypothetical protein
MKQVYVNFKGTKGKGKAVPLQAWIGPEVERGIALPFCDLGARRGPFYSQERPIVQQAVWAPGPVWTCAKNLAPTGIYFIPEYLIETNK